MNKTIKTIFLVVIIVLIVILGFFFAVRKTNIFSAPTKLPTSITFSGITQGCEDIFVYKTNKNYTAGISVYARKEKLNFSTTEKTFEIGKTDGLIVKIAIRTGEMGGEIGGEISQLYCNDVSYPRKYKRIGLTGKSGKAIISISDINQSKPGSREYAATVILKDVHFSDDKGTESNIVVDELIFKDVIVGWYPG